MSYVRTTITLPRDLHEELRIQSVKEKTSVGKIITKRLKKYSNQSEIEEDISLFKKIAKSGNKINAVEAIRNERNSH